MKCQTKLLAAVALFYVFASNAATPITSPATYLEVGKTYVFDNAGAQDMNSEYRFLCDYKLGEKLECVNAISANCLWIVEEGATEGSVSIKNKVTGGYLLDDRIFVGIDETDDNAKSRIEKRDIYVGSGIGYNSSIKLCCNQKGFDGSGISLNGRDNYLKPYGSGIEDLIKPSVGFEAERSEWFAYEVKERNPSLPDYPIEVNQGKVKYRIESPSYFAEAVAVGVASGNYSLNDLDIEDSVTVDGVEYPVIAVASDAFKGITGFTGTLTIGKQVKYIGKTAFSGCTGFTRLNLSHAIENLEKQAFSNCSGFAGGLTLPGSLNKLGTEVFSGCSSITSVVLPSSMSVIEEGTFMNCTGLTSLIMPNSLTKIGNKAFYGCGKLAGSLKFSDSLISIGNSAFLGCKSLQSLELPNSLINLGASAFSGCSGLTGSLILPTHILGIEGSIFSGCMNLNGSLEIPAGITSIGSSAFSGCSGLDGVLIIPASVASISASAFANTYFEKVVCSKLTAPECATNAFSGARQNELQVPAEAITAYKLKAPWSQFNNIHSIEQLSKIEFAETNYICKVGETVKLTVNKTPFGASGEISFMSSNAGVAAVDADGVVTGVAKGSAAIIAMSGTLTASCVVTVEDPTIAASDLNFEGIIGKVGEKIAIGVKVLPDDVTDSSINWSSSNPEVAAVDQEGAVWFNAAGRAVVTAECQGHEFSVPFVVDEVMAQTLNVFPVEAVGGVGQQFSLLALHEPENTTDKSVTWESSDPDVASVSEDGRVELSSLGSAQITARSGEHTAVCAVTVGETVNLTEMAMTGVVIDVVEGGIVVRNVAPGESIVVYAVDGKIVNGARVESEETTLNLAAGIYIVKVSPNTIAKVLVK